MDYKESIRVNASILVALHSRIGKTYISREASPAQRLEWQNACSEFRQKHDELAFIGGVDTARSRLRGGDQQAIDYALDFLEVRPYFHRSGYMYNDFMRVLRNCPLSSEQQDRYDRMAERYRAYRLARQTTAIRAYKLRRLNTVSGI